MRTVSHEYAVKLIKNSRDMLILKIIAAQINPLNLPSHNDGTQTLPLKRATSHPSAKNSFNSTLSPTTGSQVHASMDSMTAELGTSDF